MGAGIVMLIVVNAAPADSGPRVLSPPSEVLDILATLENGDPGNATAWRRLTDLLEEPFSLSTMTPAQLLSIPFVTGAEVDSLLALRDRQGGRLVLSDLETLGALGRRIAQKVRPFLWKDSPLRPGGIATLIHATRASGEDREATTEGRLTGVVAERVRMGLRIRRSTSRGATPLLGGGFLEYPSSDRHVRLMAGGFRCHSLFGLAAGGGMERQLFGMVWNARASPPGLEPSLRWDPPACGLALDASLPSRAGSWSTFGFASMKRSSFTKNASGDAEEFPWMLGAGVSWEGWSGLRSACTAFWTAGIPSRACRVRALAFEARACVGSWQAGLELVRTGGGGVGLGVGVHMAGETWESSMCWESLGEGTRPVAVGPGDDEMLRPQEVRLSATAVWTPWRWADGFAGFTFRRRPVLTRAMPVIVATTELRTRWNIQLSPAVEAAGTIAWSRNEVPSGTQAESPTDFLLTSVARSALNICFRPSAWLETFWRMGSVFQMSPDLERGLLVMAGARLSWRRTSCSMQIGLCDTRSTATRLYAFDQAVGLEGCLMPFFSRGSIAGLTFRFAPVPAFSIEVSASWHEVFDPGGTDRRTAANAHLTCGL